MVLGATGVGKSILAQRLAARLGAEYVELDALFWDAGWTQAAPDVFRARVDSDGDRPESFQQRSPSLDVDAYDKGGPALGDELDCSDCEEALEDLRGGVAASRLTCWRDYGFPGAGIPSGASTRRRGRER